MEAKVFSELAQYFSILDAVAILIVYLFTSQLKGALPKELRAYLAVALGFVVSFGFAASLGNMRMVVLFGLVYGAGAIFLRKIGFGGILDRVSAMIKRRLEKYGN